MTPVPQYEEGEAPICPIKYPEEYKEIMGYFRAVFTKEEISERAFELTKETVQVNQGNYAAWHFRRRLLHELKKDLTEEMIWLNMIGLEMQKNY